MGLKIGDKTEFGLIRADNVFIDPSTFNNNGYNGDWGGGMDVLARGDITLDQVTANGNAYYGAVLDNAWWPSELLIDEDALCSDNFFANFCSDGALNVGDWCNQPEHNPGCGDHTFDVETFCNDGPGGQFCYREYQPGYQPGMVTVTNSSFNENGWGDDELPPALRIYSYGDVSLDNVDALDNPGGGAYIGNIFEATDQIGVGYTLGDPGFDWVDISLTGTLLPLTDETTIQVPVGFGFDFYGEVYHQLYIHDNGYLSIEPGGFSPHNVAIPNQGNPNGLIAGFWDDLHSGTGFGAVYYETIGAPGNQIFIVQYQNIPHWPNNLWC